MKKAEKESFDLAAWAEVQSLWDLAETAVKTASRVFLWGPPGVGKSYLALKAGTKPVSITLTEDLTVQELMGHWIPGETWQFHHGPIVAAFKEGRLLVINEIARASGPVQDFLLAILDGHDVARLTLPSRETVTAAPGFKVIATSNSGPDLLDRALRSRFGAEVNVPLPHPQLIEKFDRAIPGLGQALAHSFLDPERAIDPRKLWSFLELFREERVPLRQAASIAFGESAPDVLAALKAGGVDLWDKM